MPEQRSTISPKIECPPTPERLKMLKGNLEEGGKGRMAEASLRMRFLCPFDIMDEGGAFDHDHRSSMDRFTAAYTAFSVALGSHYGKLNDTARDEPTGMPLDSLYLQIMKHLSRKRFEMLLMLIRPLPDTADRQVIEAHRNYLYPQQPYAQDAISALEVAMEAIGREYQRRQEQASSQQGENHSAL